jgi:hypothetical protein
MRVVYFNGICSILFLYLNTEILEIIRPCSMRMNYEPNFALHACEFAEGKRVDGAMTICMGAKAGVPFLHYMHLVIIYKHIN